MLKKEVTLLIALSILSLVVASAVYFGFESGIIDFKKEVPSTETEEIIEEEEPDKEEEIEEETNETIEKILLDPSAWCDTTSTESVTSEIFGEGRATRKILGVEAIILGKNLTSKKIICESCHSEYTFSSTSRKIEEWSNTDKLILSGLDVDKNECKRTTFSKIFLGVNESVNVNETIGRLMFSNSSLLKESWHDENGKLCLVTNKILRSIGGADCS